jgi:hypothetical protein
VVVADFHNEAARTIFTVTRHRRASKMPPHPPAIASILTKEWFGTKSAMLYSLFAHSGENEP